MGDPPDSIPEGVAEPGEAAVSPAPAQKATGARRYRLWFGTTFTALVLVALIATGSWFQITYPGGLSEFVHDLSGPPRLTDLDIQATLRRALVTTLAPQWHSDITT